ncbi:uncharacterized protein B0P05DRAFT_554296 [Gilbertella persicaria]|uniref:uncharacterized protein n=1 Tax=Gilbertella persicaria TaxID=101096 RepID=UPI00221E8A6F|nr:uncharacterized protein B0P05DRAFT_554296 [Gilbertella persicaria]KAI8064791.1 hypothetical protein B0P05DRAFT_554296 [Gilbertella persicaria]
MSFLFRSTPHYLPKQTRSLWTKITATGSSIEECVQVSIESLKQKQPDVCVVLASKSFSLKHYRQLSAELNKRLKPTVLLGGVVDRIPQVDHGISLLLGFDEKIVPFTIKDSPHRHKIRSTSVGRWGRMEERERLQTQSDHIDKVGWENFGSISTPVQTHTLPPGIVDKPSFVLSVSDNEPDELLQALDHHFPDVPKVGILGSSTPFVTGEPYALFHSTGIMGSGIVGFASYGSTGHIQVEHTAMQKLGEPIKITRCRGNIILDLDEAGATGLLLKLIHSGNKISKDEEFYLGIYPLGDSSEENVTVSRITSGDPSRGNMSVDTTADLQVGQTVQVSSHRFLFNFHQTLFVSL